MKLKNNNNNAPASVTITTTMPAAANIARLPASFTPLFLPFYSLRFFSIALSLLLSLSLACFKFSMFHDTNARIEHVLHTYH